MWTETPSFESSSVLNITRVYTSSMQELKMQRMQQKMNKKSPAFYVRRTLGMSNLIIFYSLQKTLLLSLIGLDI